LARAATVADLAPVADQAEAAAAYKDTVVDAAAMPAEPGGVAVVVVAVEPLLSLATVFLLLSPEAVVAVVAEVITDRLLPDQILK
jgi:hypothetical protein